jgi:serine acetyltransferase
VTSVAVVETLVVGVAVLPASLCWTWLFTFPFPFPVPSWVLPRAVLAAISFVPAYLVFSIALATLSAFSTRVLGWRTRPNQAWRLADLEWPLLDWMRYMVSTHVVRVLVGTFFRASPIWTLYIRMNGGRIGRGVYVNSLSLSDHNLLELGDHVVIGESVHLSGHTVEGGIVKTAAVRLGSGVSVGLGSIIGIGVEVGDGSQIGALSVVPKYTRIEPRAVYAGVPARRIERAAAL